MCTVTLLPLTAYTNGFLLTSNRDEAPQREAFPPDFYWESGVRMLYPKDRKSGGTWIGISDRSRAICLLNGGVVAHQRKASYRMSRGTVVKDLLAAVNLEETMNGYDFMHIEPCTIIAVDWKQDMRFLEIIWDGKKKQIRALAKTHHVWSSAPLYDLNMRKQRESWFQSFLKEQEHTPANLWNFHHSAGVGDKNIDVVMDRGFVRTQSITQIIKTDQEAKMIFKDIQQEKLTEIIF